MLALSLSLFLLLLSFSPLASLVSSSGAGEGASLGFPRAGGGGDAGQGEGLPPGLHCSPPRLTAAGLRRGPRRARLLPPSWERGLLPLRRRALPAASPAPPPALRLRRLPGDLAGHFVESASLLACWLRGGRRWPVRTRPGCVPLLAHPGHPNQSLGPEQQLLIGRRRTPAAVTRGSFVFSCRFGWFWEASRRRLRKLGTAEGRPARAGAVLEPRGPESALPGGVSPWEACGIRRRLLR